MQRHTSPAARCLAAVLIGCTVPAQIWADCTGVSCLNVYPGPGYAKVVVGSPSGLARPYSVTLYQANGTTPAQLSEIWLGFGTVSDNKRRPRPYSNTDGPLLECHEGIIDWPYFAIGGNSVTFYPRFGNSDTTETNSPEVQVQYKTCNGCLVQYSGVEDVEARSTDFDADGDTDQYDKLFIGKKIANGSPPKWCNLDTDDPNNTTINAADYMVVVNEMLRAVSNNCFCEPNDPEEDACEYPEDPPSTTFWPDNTPPDTTKLVGDVSSSCAAVLSWRAPGDDYHNSQKLGVASHYDLRYSNSLITSANFASATQYVGEPAPLLALQLQTLTVDPTTTGRYWAIKTVDHAGNTSSMSNVVSFPAHITDLTFCRAFKNCAFVAWTDPTGYGGAEYDVRYSTSAITASNFCSATNVGYSAQGGIEAVQINSLSQGTTYYAAVKWRGGSNTTWSGISNVVQFTTLTTGASCQTEGFECEVGGGFASKHVPVEIADLSLAVPSWTSEGCVLRYAVPTSLEGQSLDFALFDLAGRRVATFAKGPAVVGRHRVLWNDLMARGVYFARLNVGDQKLVQKVITR